MKDKVQITKVAARGAIVEADETPADVVAANIVEISKAMSKLNDSRLKREAVVTLIHDSSKVSKKTIRLVLNNLEALETTWLKPVASSRRAE